MVPHAEITLYALVSIRSLVMSIRVISLIASRSHLAVREMTHILVIGYISSLVRMIEVLKSMKDYKFDTHLEQ